MAEIDPGLLDSVREISELGNRMAIENCAFGHVLIQEGFAREQGRDKFGRKTMQLTSEGMAIARPGGRWLILREGQSARWMDEHLGGPFEITILENVLGIYPNDPVCVRDRHHKNIEIEVWQLVSGYKWEGWHPDANLKACNQCQKSGIYHDDIDGFVGPCDDCDGTGYEIEDIRVLVLPPLQTT